MEIPSSFLMAKKNIRRNVPAVDPYHPDVPSWSTHILNGEVAECFDDEENHG